MTPGPWRYSPPQGAYGHEVVSGIGLESKLVCQTSHHPRQQERAEADAKAIAALPEVLDALMDLVEAIEHNTTITLPNSLGIDHDSIKDEHNAAIDALKNAGVFE